MSLKFQCRQCQKTYNVEDAWAGRRVQCKACGGVMLVPGAVAPLRVIPLVDPNHLGERESFPPPYSPPPAQADAAAVGPHVDFPGAVVIDRWLPWAAVGLFALCQLTRIGSTLMAASQMSSQSGKSLLDNSVATAVIVVVGVLGMICASTASGGLMLLGVWLSAVMMNFANHRWLYWRCIAAACATLAVNSILDGMGMDITAARYFVAIIIGLGILWLLLRLRPPQFALAGGLAMLLGIIIPGALLLGAKSAIDTLVVAQHRAMAGAPTVSPVIGFTPSPNAVGTPAWNPSQVVSRQTSVRHLQAINNALRIYAMNHNGGGPATLAELTLMPGMIQTGDVTPPVAGMDYVYRGYYTMMPGDTVVCYEQGDRSIQGGVNVLFQNGTVRFYPDDSADAVLNAPVNQAMLQAAIKATAQPPLTFVPRMPNQFQMPTPHRVTPPQPVQPQFTTVDPATLMPKIAAAFQSYYTSHNSTYPRMPRDLVSADLLQATDLPNGPAQRVRTMMPLPNVSPLPAEAIVVYLLDTQTSQYTVLFGDWHVETLDTTGFNNALHKWFTQRTAAGKQ